MAISFNRYVNITSGVAASTQVATRELIGRLFSENPLVPTGAVLEFTSASTVGDYFGTTSVEYKRAAKYFSFISKTIVTPKKISFARWVNADTAPQIFGASLTASLASLQLITNGSITLTLGTTNLVSGLDFSAAGSLAAVATVLQTAIRTKTGAQWTSATVSYDASRGSFNLTGGSAVAATVTVSAGTVGTDIATLIGWLPQSTNGAIWSNGALTETITQTLDNSTNLNNNFAAFVFIPTLDQAECVEAAQWTTLQNVRYQYSVGVPDLTTAINYSAALGNYGGVGLELSPLSTEYPDQYFMTILAATDYNARNGTQNYMYQVMNLTPSVTTDIDANTYDALRVNYYGQTQTAGQPISFWQRGTLLGLPTDPDKMNIFANEIWLKDAVTAALGNLLLALPKISANTQGQAQIATVILDVIGQALFNGVISVGGIINVTQQLYIAQVTGDADAWYQVQNIGYWLDVEMVSVQNNSVTEWHAKYTLVYKKDDVISKIDGTHQLI